MSKDVPLAVEVPTSSQDKPSWVKVGVIAAVGFVVGIAWPRVVGVRLGPSAPSEATSNSAAHVGRAPESAPSSAPKAASAIVPATSVVSSPPSASASASATAGPPVITVQKGNVLSCKTSDGEAKKGAKECGPVSGID